MPLNPDLLDNLHAARRAPGADTLKRLGSPVVPDLGKLAHDAIAANVEVGKVSADEWREYVGDEAMSERLQLLIDETCSLYARIDRTPPTLDEIAEVIDLPHLAEVYTAMTTDGRRPEFVLSLAQMTPLQARDLYGSLQQDKTIPGNPLRDGGLYINDTVEDDWNSLNTPPAGVSMIEVGGMSWTLRIVPGTLKPIIVDIDHSGKRRGQTIVPSITHPTINEYLTLQALRIRRGGAPVDPSTYSWLNATLTNSAYVAPYGYWRDGQVWVGWNVARARDSALGVRPPVNARKGSGHAA